MWWIAGVALASEPIGITVDTSKVEGVDAVALSDRLVETIGALPDTTAAVIGGDHAWSPRAVVLCGGFALGATVRVDCRLTGMEDPKVLGTATVQTKTSDIDGLACQIVQQLAPAWAREVPTCGKGD